MGVYEDRKVEKRKDWGLGYNSSKSLGSWRGIK